MKLLPARLSSHPTVSVLRLYGTIGVSGRFGGASLNDAALAPLVERAFGRGGRRGKPAAVALAINSPGGSPVQSALIAARIRRLAAERDIPVFAFCEDVAASGGYWLATAADEIYADHSSILGSIGVISASFGLHELIARHGIERRVHTAGEDKSMLDPFRPERAEDVERLKNLQAEIHQAFIAQVTGRRGGKLTRDDIFTGEVWTGRGAVEIGLADGLGHLVPMMKDRFGDKVKFNVVAQRRSWLSRMGAPGMAEATDAVLQVAEDRATWARYGQ